MVHRTRIDWWLLSLLGGFTSLGLASGIFLIVHLGDWPTGLTAVGLALAVLAVTWPIRYTIEADRLRIRAGLFLWRIPLAAIRAASLSHNPVFAPAWSLRRIQVDFVRASGRRSMVLISPRDRLAFLQELAQAEPDLVLEGERLLRPARPPTGPKGAL